MSDLNSEILLYLRQLTESEPEIIFDLPKPSESDDADSTPAKAFAPEQEERALRLQELANIVSVCALCQLAKTRNKVVFGVGDPSSALMFIGEAPGADEDAQGEPFVGRAGQLLTKIIGAMGLTRRQVYIANILKCRPPGNRNPSPNEAAACLPYLRRQIEIIRPKVIISLGLVAATHLLDLPPTTAVKDLRGRILEFAATPVVVTYHPAALLRNPSLKAPTWQDVQVALKLLSGEIKWEPKQKEAVFKTVRDAPNVETANLL